MTNYAHITPQFRDVMEKSDLDRLAFLDEPRWVDYQAANNLMDILNGLLRKPERPRMPNLMFVGESNTGKTTVVTRFKELS
ncbi:TniB family NTP-binding protein, partial [Pseudomonas sp. MD195_PC81_125]|uniref:TniB family NTP-binding protein n=1 Tax=Pseudomonas sp. MD195_PC81_125 TaxID=2741560 RepID=UPI0015FD8E33|nr:TniB family NTP-binding protein [Pseudomonas sp. MD195_PC81_125]